jgi:hypothetical protein
MTRRNLSSDLFDLRQLHLVVSHVLLARVEKVYSSSWGLTSRDSTLSMLMMQLAALYDMGPLSAYSYSLSTHDSVVQGPWSLTQVVGNPPFCLDDF